MRPRRLLATIAFLLLLAPLCEADYESTGNYTIPADVQAGGGGDKAKSSNYLLDDTIGEPGIGFSGSNNYNLDAGYRQTSNTAYISITAASSVNIGTITGNGQATNSLTYTVITDDTAGYSLAWEASTAAMISGPNTIAAFVPSVANVPDTWSIPTSTSAWGARLASASTDTAVEWGTDSSSEKWLNISTSSRVIVSRTSRTSLTGSTETVQYRTEVGSTKIQPNGTYTVNVTLTAVAL